jgi:ferric-dicitrate binding protein FerR (iron transport regulator)
VEARSDAGTTDQWTFESNPPSWYRSVGLARADFAKAVGQTVTVEGVRARNGTLFGYMRKIKLPDGTSLELINSADPK